MKTPEQRRAAIERRASTWSDPAAADRLRQLAEETDFIVEVEPSFRHRG
ncbi:hypothetical protein [Qipengyuania citrea]|nr:hypothetical protein [Qipengyuania citrea]MCP2016825.1 hypothetical protein [Qipengyuania citrea]